MANKEQTSQTESKVEIALLSLISTGTLKIALLPFDDLVSLTQEAGYSGIEWHLANIRAKLGLSKLGLKIRKNLLAAEKIHSLHQSFNSGNLLTALKHPNPKLALASWLLLPEIGSSLIQLKALQKRLGVDLPIVAYPADKKIPEETEERKLAGLTTEALMYQPVPELLNLWEAENLAALVEAGKNRGFNALCLDLLHMRRVAQGKTLGNWEQVLEQLIHDTAEIHLSVGRIDVRGEVDASQELSDLLNGQGDSEIIKILKFLRDHFKGRYIVEIPAQGLAQLMTKEGIPFNLKNFIAAHKKLTRNILDLIN